MRSRALCETRRRMKKTLVSGTVALMLAAAAGAVAAGSFSLGAATFVKFPVYKDADPQWYPLPVVQYEGERFYVNGIEGGAYLFKEGGHSLRLGVSWLPMYFKTDRSDNAAVKKLDDRKTSLAGMLSYQWAGSFGKISAGVKADLLGESDGVLVGADYSYDFRFSKLVVTPSVGVLWANDKFNDYYFGISRNEAARSGLDEYHPEGGLAYTAGVKTSYAIDEHWVAFGTLGAMRLSDDVKDSPMTESSAVNWTVGAGIMYRFD